LGRQVFARLVHSSHAQPHQPVKTVAKMGGSHEPLILNYDRANRQLGSVIVEGFDTKLRLVTRNSYGFRSVQTLDIALDHVVRQLPTPPLARPFA